MTHARILNRQGRSRFVLLCDHASNHVPVELGNLGLRDTDLERHIAWDIGAAGVTEIMSRQLGAPAILCGVSRLVIDCNRKLTSAELIPAVVDGTLVPGNATVDSAARAMRIERWFLPYHDAIEGLLAERIRQRLTPAVIAIHSMTPILHGRPRPWQIALSSHTDRRLTDPVLAALKATRDVVVGDNEPYCIDPLVDYSIPFHAWRRDLLHLQVEIRQDEIESAAGQRSWAIRFAEALTRCI